MQQRLTPTRTVDGVIGPFDEFCDGYGNPGSMGTGYVSVLKLSTGSVLGTTDEALEAIASLNRAETSDAYVGQVNATSSGSFSWLNGMIWGYDIARHDELASDSLKPLFCRERRDGTWLPVYRATPLLEAGERLFGTATVRRFPLMPGSHIICGAKEVTASGPSRVWSAIALAVADDRDENSSLFIEEVGSDSVQETYEPEDRYLHEFRRLERLVDSAMLCGDDVGVRFKEVFVGFTSEWVPEGKVGCALSCVPYLVLARHAVPPTPNELLTMSLSEWEAFVAPRLAARETAL
ncbi:MAG: histidine decarboxylase, pyruvoyl type [Acidimicrobiales bacterium]